MLEKEADGIHQRFVPDIPPGTLYNFRVGDHILIDPYALAIDRPYGAGLPRCIVTELPPPVARESPHFTPGGLIYELNVRAFTMRHPDIPEAQRGTIAALAHPAIIAHLRKLKVAAVELMPIVAWIDERHLPPLGLVNSWGYNPVSFMAIDPRLGTLGDLRATAAALHAAGIGVILDLVFNHSGESDIHGQTLSFRGLAERDYYRHAHDGSLINDTGCGNTIACDHPMMRRMILDSLRHFVAQAGIDGFRFDLAPILGRTAHGFDPDAALFREIAADPLLSDRILIAEPWDIGPGGYQLGNFPSNWLEWNDRYRDDMRRFWRGDRGMIGDFATRLAGSSDIFGGAPATRTVNFLAAHDGFTLADLVAHEHKHNFANGEQNRDGHDDNISWNNGAEGVTDDPAIRAARRRDLKVLLATLFASRGTIMLTAGDEFGRTQQGNNNAYCQDNAITWLDWAGRDTELEDHVAELAKFRAANGLDDPSFLTDADVQWLTDDRVPFTEADWQDIERNTIAIHLGPVRIRFDRVSRSVTVTEIKT